MRRASCLLWTLCFAGVCFGAQSSEEREKNLPEPYRKWLDEEVTYIISDVEREAFLSLGTESERQAFIDAFWRKRDPNPSTPENEFEIEHYKRLAYANEFFGRDTFRPGWQTDRGRYYILLGKPNVRRPLEATDAIYPSELWFYNDAQLKYAGLPPFFYLLFFRRGGVGEFQLYSPLTDGPQALLTGYHVPLNDFRDDVQQAYEKLYAIDSELAQASLSFRTDEGDTAQFQNPSFGTLSLLEDIKSAPFYHLDTSYAERLDFERGNVESDYLFTYVPSFGAVAVLPGPGDAHYLHWIVELDADSVGFVRDEDAGKYSSFFIASLQIVPVDNENRLILDERRESFITLTDAQAQGSLRLPIALSGMTPIVPGTYKARVILRNRACPSRRETDCVRSYTLFDANVSVPESQQDHPALSDLVLAYGRELVGGEPQYRPFRFGSVAILPNPRGVYVIGDNLVVGVAPRNSPPGSHVRFEVEGGDGASAEKTRVEKTVDAGGLANEPLIQELSLAGIEGGRFEIVATLLDAEGKELDRRASPFTISPRTSIARPGVRGSIAPPRPEIPGVVPMLLGEQYLKLEQKDKARPLLERAVRENGQLGQARELLAGLLLEAGDSAGVLSVLAPLVPGDPNAPNAPERFEVASLLGQAYFHQKQYAKSIELLEKALKMHPPEVQLLNVLASAYHELGNDARAREILERSLSLNPDQSTVKELLEKLKAEATGPPPPRSRS